MLRSVKDVPVSHIIVYHDQNDDFHKKCLLFPTEEPLSDKNPSDYIAQQSDSRTDKFCLAISCNICAVVALQ